MMISTVVLLNSIPAEVVGIITFVVSNVVMVNYNFGSFATKITAKIAIIANLAIKSSEEKLRLHYYFHFFIPCFLI